MRKQILTSILAGISVFLVGCETRTSGPSEITSGPEFITNGTLDGTGHPAVVLIVMDIDGAPAFRCSGTLLAPTVVLTAGHCTGEPGEFSGMRVFTEADVQHGTNNYPHAGPNTIEATAWHAHPLFTEAAFFVHDVGVIQLSAPVNLAASQYGHLPTVNQLDALQSGHATGFTSVGYGVQRINKVKLEAQKIRMLAEPWLIQINTPFVGPGSLLLSNNASTGGTCFGDSGGPNYLGSSNVVAGVTSFALNGSCGGTGGVFRTDRRDVLAFVNQYLP